MKLPFLIPFIKTSALVGPSEQLQLRAVRILAGYVPDFLAVLTRSPKPAAGRKKSQINMAWQDAVSGLCT